MLLLFPLFALLAAVLPAQSDLQSTLARPNANINGIPFSTRVYWMRQANAILASSGSPCPQSAFGSVIVNHTLPGVGDLVCTGVNSRALTGNPTMHGEVAAISNCSRIFTDMEGRYKMTPAQSVAAFAQLSIYTNAESCPMCATAIRYAGFREYIYGTSIETLVQSGWTQVRIPSQEIFRQAYELPNGGRMIAGVLSNETDIYFGWQNDHEAQCPPGCARTETGHCM
ncbi:cytidine deaminase-like protein, partial [Exidia glandulosa HHB12029]